MPKPNTIKGLLKIGGKRLTALKARSEERHLTLEAVRAALPPPLAQAVVSAGIESDRMTLGVAGASWASRLRYVTDPLRERVGASLGVDIKSVRIKVVPPRA